MVESSRVGIAASAPSSPCAAIMSDRNQKNDKIKEEYSKDKGPRREKTLREHHVETLDILEELSTLLNTRLSRPQLAYCASLLEHGVNPEALANVIKAVRAQYPEEQTNFEASA
ncbi:hypothetical protein OPT61_g9668 [Boeremia exigua]|uniref:Uncharacterized protein n=1 Tax=Boeremia exigua TaxID=749465 RepID=A0ACC2HT30_9PLEO|nr:hypothetical protein OPT61_g9668 [Boeremia exigua]